MEELKKDNIYATSDVDVIEGAKRGQKSIKAKSNGIVSLSAEQSEKRAVLEFLEGIHDKVVPQREGIGIYNEGGVDDFELERVKETARKIIKENITKLYKEKVKKVAIIGTALSAKFAPYDDPSWEIWGLNDHWNQLPRATRWFESQTMDHCENAPVTHDHSMMRSDWLKKCPIPVYMPDHYESCPQSIEYPIEGIQKWLSEVDPSGVNYFTNTISFEIALAIYEGFDVIHLYGVDMAVGSEYEKQRPSCEFFLGIAKGLGIKTYIPDESDLLKCMERYGMMKEGHGKNDAFSKKMKDRRTYQQSQLSKANQEIAKRQEEIQRLSAVKFKYEGALEDLESVLKVWDGI